VPVPNEVVVSGKPFEVAGVVFTRGMPEPITINSVTVQVENGPLIEAVMKSNPPQLSTVNYSAQATTVAGVGASRLVTVKATDENGASGSASVTIFVGSPTPVNLWTSFIANDPSNRILVSSSADGISWAPHTNLPESSKFAPSLAVFNNRLFVAFIANDPSNRILAKDI
jgi:hypothetical protein